MGAVSRYRDQVPGRNPYVRCQPSIAVPQSAGGRVNTYLRSRCRNLRAVG